jgi:hypothetical protein
MPGPFIFIATNRLREVTVVQVHPDAASLEFHMGLIGDRARAGRLGSPTEHLPSSPGWVHANTGRLIRL